MAKETSECSVKNHIKLLTEYKERFTITQDKALTKQKEWKLQQEEINHEQETNCEDFLCV